MHCALQTASGETLLILKEPLVKLRTRRLTTLIYIASIIDEFILVLDVMHAHDASVDFRRAHKRTMVLETNSPKEGAAAEQQRETQPTRN
jgi:hypothetical protein